jgi:hypothetical protein
MESGSIWPLNFEAEKNCVLIKVCRIIVDVGKEAPIEVLVHEKMLQTSGQNCEMTI